jgi:branched-chain amino acid transport system permease protein
MTPIPHQKIFYPARLLIWGLFALMLIAAPWIFSQGRSLSLLSQIGALMIFGLSYNMLLGQGGMLSFGHAVYSGLGAFVAIHAMNLAAKGTLSVPMTLIPLVGGVAGMFFGILFGYVTTKKSGTTFAMITLGMVELVSACSLMFPDFFGGEGGISADRTLGNAFLGITYGPQIQVYYLIAFWLFLCTAAMYAFTQTPLGRIMNAVRDNPERAEFIGYDTQWVRYLTLILSAFFAGIAGGLSAINFEIVSAENVSAIRSGGVLLFTFIGGVGFFFGPILGAVVGIFMTVLLPDISKAWQLYLGLFFIVMVRYAPGGIASLIMMQFRVIRHGKFQCIWRQLLALGAAALLCAAALVLMIEMLYHHSLNAGGDSMMRWFGVGIDTASAAAWVLALGLLVAGAGAVRFTQPRFQQRWVEINSEIEHHMSGGAHD